MSLPVKKSYHAVPQIPLVFMGTPEFGKTLLAGLVELGYNVVGVVTQPDRPVGRDRVLTPSPVKEFAVEHKLPLLQPTKLDESSFRAIQAWKPDLIVVAAYGKILPEKILSLPGLGCLNVHASLLPRWRGASPVQNALIAGDPVTGITLMHMDAGLDTGNIVSQKSLAIPPEATTGSLLPQLATIGVNLLQETLPAWIKRTITPQVQNEKEVTLCQLIEREDGRIYWSNSAEEIYNRYRGLSPWPGIFTFWKRGDDLLRIKLLRVSLQRTSPMLESPLGTVFEIGEKIGVHAGTGILFLEEVQLEGKSPVNIRDFQNGNPDFVGSLLV